MDAKAKGAPYQRAQPSVKATLDSDLGDGPIGTRDDRALNNGQEQMGDNVFSLSPITGSVFQLGAVTTVLLVNALETEHQYVK